MLCDATPAGNPHVYRYSFTTEQGAVKYLDSAQALAKHHERNTMTVSFEDLDSHSGELANRVLENYFRCVRPPLCINHVVIT